jgi:hypothetical protein
VNPRAVDLHARTLTGAQCWRLLGAVQRVSRAIRLGDALLVEHEALGLVEVVREVTR